ncbi:MAG: type II secretion system protein [Verrucomicrobiota bacterium]|jgi:prepilin-type N-terminal cleavage/methylation domain-containing protein
MPLHLITADTRNKASGFTLAEILISLMVFSLVSSGIIYGYVQLNRAVQWSAISLAAQSFASQGVEQARAANWNPRGFPMSSNYPGSFDELAAPTNYVEGGTNYVLDIPIKGTPSAANFAFFVTNYISITNLSSNPALRQIRADAVWQFYLTDQIYTNTAILLRAPDQ